MADRAQPEIEFDVALSFAGTDREIARVIARVAQANGLRVFIDEGYTTGSWGKNLNELLSVVYDGRSRYCLILISEAYCRRPYTRQERRYALDRAIESRTEYILPVRLDDAWLEGLPRSTAYLDLRDRQMTPTEVGRRLVEKVRGGTVLSPGLEEEKVLRVEDADRSATERLTPPDARAVAFVRIQPLLAEPAALGAKPAWKEEAPGHFSGRGDPMFDVTILNQAGRAVTLTEVGVEFVALGFKVEPIFGGGGAEIIELHRTYKLDVPDLWVRVAQLQLASGARFEHPPYAVEPIAAQELVPSRLSDPVLLRDETAYRFGLHLFDYEMLCPNDVAVRFWVRTNAGEDRSSEVGFSYFISSDVPGHGRYRLALGEEPEYELRKIAYGLWEQAGRPEGRDLEFWNAAKAMVIKAPEQVLMDYRYARLRSLLPGLS